MPKKRIGLLDQLISQLYIPIEQAGFELLKETTGYFSDQPNQVNFFVISDGRVGRHHVLTATAAIKYKLVERTWSEFLNIPEFDFYSATIGLGAFMKFGDKSHWVLTRKTDISQVYDGLLGVFSIAQTFFNEYSSIQKVAEYMLSRHIFPYEGQKILICAYLLKDVAMLKLVHSRVNGYFGPLMNAPDRLNDHVRKHFTTFNELYEKLLPEMETG